MGEWIVIAVAWMVSGVIGGQLLSYPGDGLNFRHAFGLVVGPFFLLVALLERVFPD